MVKKGSFGRFIKAGVSAFLFFFFFFYCHSQSFLIHQYSETDGLPSAEVNDITQDHWGRIWFATRAGISCYDGVSWRNYTVSDGLPALSFVKISVDRKGRVWALPYPVQSRKLSLVFFDGKEWKQTNEQEAAFSIRHEISSFQLLEKGGNPDVVIGSVDLGLFLWKDKRWKILTSKSGLPGDCITGIAVDKGNCYVATDNGMVLLRNDGTIDTGLNRSLNFPNRNVQGICVEYKDKYPGYHLEESRVWLYGEGWLGYFTESSDNLVLFNIKGSFQNEYGGVKLQPDYRGGLYMGDIFRISYFNYLTGTQEDIHIENGLIGRGSNSIFVDFEKNVWIACDRGASKIASRRFTNFQKIHGLVEDEVSAVLEYEPGKFILGHNKGITFRDGSQFSRILFTRKDGTPFPNCRVLDMRLDSKRNIWVVVEGVGLAKINKLREIKWYNQNHGLPLDLMCLEIDKNDGIWVGGKGGIFSRVGDRFAKIKSRKLSQVMVRKLYMTKEDSLCAGSISSGVYIYKRKSWKNYRLPGMRMGNSIYAIREDSRGRLLFGTLGGLYILEQEALEKFKEKDFEINRPVYFIIEDKGRKFWFGTNNGVVFWDGSREIRYSIPEGLIGQETNRAAGIVDSRGRIWIGTNRGVSIYDEQFDNYLGWKPLPKLRLLYLEVKDRKIPLDQPAKLSHETQSMVFCFNGISFIDEKALRFRHKLEGFDKEWSNEHYPYNQVISYSNLSPGRYRFNLRVRNSLGVWSDPVVSPELVILEPFYRQWWFYLLAILAACFVLYAVLRFFTQKRYAALLEKQVDERTGQLQAAEKKYRTLFEESKDVIFISTPEGKIIDMNPAGMELFGFESKDELLEETSTIDLYYNPVDRDAFREEIEKNGYVKDYELILKRKDGDKIAAQVTATLVRDKEGNIAAYRGTIRDVSDKKRLEQQLLEAKKMEAIGTLAGGIAHDFNNILGVISGNTEMVLDGLREGTELHRITEQIAIAAERASELVKQILTFGRHSKKKLEPLEISGIVIEVLKLLRSSLPGNVEIRQDIRVNSGFVLANRTQIYQVVMNLCTNAVYAMREKGGVLNVSLEKVTLNSETVKEYDDIKIGDYLRLIVADTGQGIPLPVIKRIFEPYFTTKKTGEGSGMGLAVVHGIVKSHGGDISVYSEPGKGTTFHVLLPQTESSREPGPP